MYYSEIILEDQKVSGKWPTLKDSGKRSAYMEKLQLVIFADGWPADLEPAMGTWHRKLLDCFSAAGEKIKYFDTTCGL